MTPQRIEENVMISVDIPGFERLRLEYLVLDFNGTLALDGELLPGVAERITELSKQIEIHVLSADLHGSCNEKLAGLPVKLSIIKGREDDAKLDYVKDLGREACCAVGNGRNDRLMLEAVEVGICVMGLECSAVAAASRSDVLAPSVQTALDLLLKPNRLLGTLRS